MTQALGTIRQVAYVVKDMDAAKGWDGSNPVRPMPLG